MNAKQERLAYLAIMAIMVLALALFLIALGMKIAEAAPSTVIQAHWAMNDSPNAAVLHDTTGSFNGTTGSKVIRDRASHRYTPIDRKVYEPRRIDTVPDNDSLDPGDSPFSVRVKFLWNRNQDNNLIQKGQGSPAGGLFKMKTSVPLAGQPPGYIKCLFRGSTGDSQVESYSAPRLDDGQWHVVNCARTADGTVMKIDGVVVDTNDNDPGAISNDWPITIGGNTHCDAPDLECNYWWGRIGDIRWTVTP